MKKKTKQFAAALCLMLFASMALGSGSTDSAEKKEVVAADSTETSDTTEASGTEAAEEASDTSSTDVTITEQVLVDQNDIKITAAEYVTDSM